MYRAKSEEYDELRRWSLIVSECNADPEAVNLFDLTDG